jgi:16S rRNA (adenine(1408)-N(1))-methyltransferase
VLIVKGNKILEINEEELNKIKGLFKKTVLDLGTGDGRFVYENALLDPTTLFIGIDPSQTQLKEYSKKAQKKKLANALFLTGSIEIMPEGLRDTADLVYVILPWGTLLQGLVKPSSKTILSLKNLLKTGGKLEVILGYTEENEPSETKRLDLPEINKNLVYSRIIPVFEKEGFKFEEYLDLDKNALTKYKTTWSKKLVFGKERPLIYFKFSKN